jgi:hypothetical protein
MTTTFSKPAVGKDGLPLNSSFVIPSVSMHYKIDGLYIDACCDTFSEKMRRFEEDEWRSATSPHGINFNFSAPSSSTSPPHNRTSLLEDAQPIQFCEDIFMKSHFLATNPIVARLFTRFLYFGAWIFPLADECKARGLPPHIMSSARNNSDGSASVDGSLWTTSVFGENRSFELFRSLLGEEGLVLMTFALALQQFCRSDVFSTVSEADWSLEAIRAVPIRNYLSERNVTRLLAPVTGRQQSTEGLLDDMFFHLHRFTKYGRDTEKRYFQSSDWVYALENVLSTAPFALQLESAHPMASPVWTIAQMNEEAMGDASVIPQDTRGRILSSKLSSMRKDRLLYGIHTTSETTHVLLPSSLSCSSPATPCVTCDTKPREEFDFVAITPVLRSPLMLFSSASSSDEMDIFPANYDWSLFQVVTVQWNLQQAVSPFDGETMDLYYVTAASDLSYLVARMLG